MLMLKENYSLILALSSVFVINSPDQGNLQSLFGDCTVSFHLYPQ